MNQRSGSEAIDPIQETLRDLACLAIVGDHVRWVLRGGDPAGFAAWLTVSTAKWRAWSDRVAAHMAHQDTPPDGRVRALARDIPWNWVPDGWLSTSEAVDLMQDRLRRLAEWAEARRSASTAREDEALLGEVQAGLEAQLEALSSM